MGRLYLERHADIEDEMVRELVIPPHSKSVSVSLDRVSVPMEEPIRRLPGRPRKSAPKVTRQFRMAYCGTVTLHDGEGNAMHTIRYGRMPDRDPQMLCSAMANDVYRIQQRCPWLRVALLADGAAEMWNLLESSFPDAVFGSVHRLVDFWHLMEKLASAAKILYGDYDQGQAALKRWRASLRRRRNAAQEILAELVDSGCEDIALDASRPVHEAITYLANHSRRMNYAGAIAKGLPIGSGNVEATCKTLVGIRMKRAGARWKTDTGEHVLHLRALALSNRWDAAMTKLAATQRTAVRMLAA